MPKGENVAAGEGRSLGLREASDVLRVFQLAVAVQGDVAAAEGIHAHQAKGRFGRCPRRAQALRSLICTERADLP
jgi:hypothetical protein